jgi:phage shock protein E
MLIKRMLNTILLGCLLSVSPVVWGCAQADTSAATDISQEEFLSSPPEGAVILDVRTEGEFGSGHVPGAVNIPHDELASRLSELASTDQPVVVYCRSGKRAGMASEVLVAAGYTQVLHLEGDMNEWQANGLPTE